MTVCPRLASSRRLARGRGRVSSLRPPASRPQGRSEASGCSPRRRLSHRGTPSPCSPPQTPSRGLLGRALLHHGALQGPTVKTHEQTSGKRSWQPRGQRSCPRVVSVRGHRVCPGKGTQLCDTHRHDAHLRGLGALRVSRCLGRLRAPVVPGVAGDCEVCIPPLLPGAATWAPQSTRPRDQGQRSCLSRPPPALPSLGPSPLAAGPRAWGQAGRKLASSLQTWRSRSMLS